MLLCAATRTACGCCYRVGDGRADHPATAQPPAEVNAVNDWGHTPLDKTYIGRRETKRIAKENPKLKQRIKNNLRGYSHTAQLVKKFGGKSGFQLRKSEQIPDRTTAKHRKRKRPFRKTAPQSAVVPAAQRDTTPPRGEEAGAAAGAALLLRSLWAWLLLWLRGIYSAVTELLPPRRGAVVAGPIDNPAEAPAIAPPPPGNWPSPCCAPWRATCPRRTAARARGTGRKRTSWAPRSPARCWA